MNKTTQFVRNNATGEAGMLLLQSADEALVDWLKSDRKYWVPMQDITLASVPVPTLTVFKHGITQEMLEHLEDRFVYLTEDGWTSPEWINVLR